MGESSVWLAAEDVNFAPETLQQRHAQDAPRTVIGIEHNAKSPLADAFHVDAVEYASQMFANRISDRFHRSYAWKIGPVDCCKPLLVTL